MTNRYLFVVVRCPHLVAPSHSLPSGCVRGSADNVFGDKCLFACDIGYRRVNGSTERICQANGTWSGEMLYCRGNGGNQYIKDTCKCL